MSVVIFDLDDTLYDQFEPFKLTYDHFFDIPIDKKKLFVSFRKYSDDVFLKSQNNQITMDQMYCYRLINAFRDFNISISEKQALMFQEVYKNNQSNIKLDDNMVEVLNYLKHNNIKNGIITNGPSEHQRNKIKSLDVTKYVKDEDIIISGEVNVSKPELKIFKMMEDKFSLKENFVYIGDSFENDVVGSNKACWNCIWINKYNKQVETNNLNYIEVCNTSEVLDVLKKIITW